MAKNKGKIRVSLLICVLLAGVLSPVYNALGEEEIAKDIFFRAEVVKILENKETVLPDGVPATQQRLLLRGLEEPYKGQEIEFNGIGNYDVINKQLYREGDTVLVVASRDSEGETYFYISDYVRTNGLWILFIVFCLTLILVGRFKGLRSLVTLVLSFVVIIGYIIPQILDDADPIIVTVIGSSVILLIIIYLTEGWRTISHLSILSIFISLVITIFVSWFFTGLARLTGVTGEEVSFLVDIGPQTIDFRGLLLAGIIIGALGVLDDVVISQIATVEQLSEANPSYTFRELFKRSYHVGISHIASMTNTLFLAYAGVSLPILILFTSGQSAFQNWMQAINNESIATEIVRTLAGSIGLILAVPIATLLAAWKYGRK